jgi:hypothetical protein
MTNWSKSVNWQDVAIVSIGAIGTLMGWIIRALWSNLDLLRNNINDLERKLPETYARRDDLNNIAELQREDMRGITDALRRIEDKLDMKADR